MPWWYLASEEYVADFAAHISPLRIRWMGLSPAHVLDLFADPTIVALDADAFGS